MRQIKIEMITHEEARNLLINMKLSKEKLLLFDYITEQQAKDKVSQKEHELLGLYQNYFDLNLIDVVNDGHVYGDSRNTQKSILIIKKIKLKEKELEEMK